MELKKIQQQLGKLLLLAFVFIPFIRLSSGVLGTQLPFQYAPIVVLSFVFLLIKARRKYLVATVINAALLIYNLLNTTSMPTIKMQIAAFTYINSFLSIYLIFKDDENAYDTFLRYYFRPLFYSSIVFMALCLLSFFLNLWNFPFDATMKEITYHLTFIRGDSNGFRSNILIRLNPLGAILHDIQNIQYIGPQLIINPFIAFALGLIFPKEINSRMTKGIFFSLLLLLIMITNSRSMLLTAILLSIALWLKNTKIVKSPLINFGLIPFPFIQYFLSDRIISGRICQYNFVKNDLTVFGHGIGTGISQLNSTCGETKSLERLQGIQSYCFDNIHLEFLHYFGISGYLALVIISILFIWKFRNLNTLLLAILVYFFFALNLNLFEIYFVPLVVALIYFSLRPEKAELIC